MDLGLKDKVAVITGASKGIGFAIAKEFLSEGAKVTICARNKNELLDAQKMLEKHGEVAAMAIDACDDRDISRFAEFAIDSFGSIDCWVNNVGASPQKEGDFFTSEEIDAVYNVCFKSAVFGCQEAFKHMKSKGGSILNIASLAARCGTVGRSTLYGPLKSAVVKLSTSFAGEYAAYGVRVNALLPGFTLTPAINSTIPPDDLEFNVRGTLVRRAASPQEIARPVVFLCSDAASYITATSLEVSGGRAVVLNPDYSYIQKELG